MAYHQNCALCCELGRCHWCLNRPGPVQLFDSANNLVFHACSKHAELVHSSNRFPNLDIIGYDGTFRPIELTIDEEAAQRASVSIHSGHSSNTPATLR